MRHFEQSVNKFPIKNTEDAQNERLRKIHTFQATFDDFVSYVNQKIKDTKKIKENMIKNFDEFVNEASSGFRKK